MQCSKPLQSQVGMLSYVVCSQCGHIAGVLIGVCPAHPSGVKLLKQYQDEYATLEAQRQELTNAEKLFDLPITMYPDMIEVDRELKGLAKVYELFEAQRVGGSLCMHPPTQPHTHTHTHTRKHPSARTCVHAHTHIHTHTRTHTHIHTCTHTHTCTHNM